VKYAFIQRHRQVWPITVQCRLLEVSVSGYHAHLASKVSAAPRRHLSDDALLVHIKAVHSQTRGSYGRLRILRELRHDGVRVGKQRLQRLMQTRRHAMDETIAWLLWYNCSRLHSTLNYVSPMQFEQHWQTQQAKQV
jgi:transposase InsO family protein